MSEKEAFYIKGIEHCVNEGISKFIMFIKNDKTILEVKSFLENNKIDLELIAVTFPANEKMYKVDEDDKMIEFIPDAARGNKIKNLLKENDIPLISSPLPFEGIVIPGDNFNPYKVIEQTLNLVNNGLANLVQSLLIATDNGLVSPGERVLVINVLSAIDVRGTNTRLLFHPEEGLHINNIIKLK